MSVQRARGALREPSAGERPVRRRLRADTLQLAAASPEVDVPIGPRAARVRGRPQLAQEPQLFERRLELGAGLAPLDRVEGAERRLDRGSLAPAREVRAKPRPEVPRAADVEGEPVRAAEDVDARACRRARDERALHVESAGARRGELDEVGDRPRAALLCEPEQDEEDLRRRPGVRQRAVARLASGRRRSARAGEADAARPLAEQPSRKPDGVDHGRGDAPPGEALDLAVEEREVEARVVRDEHRLAREREQAPHRELGARRAAEVARGDAGERR